MQPPDDPPETPDPELSADRERAARVLDDTAGVRRVPRLVRESYAWRRELVRESRPDPAHLALARWSRSRPGVAIATQYVDGLHTEALEEVAAGRSWNDDGETETG